jgi:hypothetical protein
LFTAINDSSLSQTKNNNRSIVQGSQIGPILYIMHERDLKPLSSANILYKNADDIHPLVPENSDYLFPSSSKMLKFGPCLIIIRSGGVTVKVRRMTKAIDDAQVNELRIYEKQKREKQSKNRSITAGGARVDKRDISEMTLAKSKNI